MDSLQASLVTSLEELVQRVGNRTLQELWVCSAYIQVDGVTAIAPLLKASAAFAALGAGEQTDPAGVTELTRRGVVVRLRRHLPDSEFHPKCYFGLEANGRAWAAVGSANLTGAGARRNVELLSLVEGPATDPYFGSLLTWCKAQHRRGVQPSAEIMKRIEATFKSRGQKTPAQLEAAERLAEFFDREEAKRRKRSLLSYIQSTRLFASYKLVILGLLLQAPGGSLNVEQCARQFQIFYRVLKSNGLAPERQIRGTRQLKMIDPVDLDEKAVTRLLTGRIGSTITKRGLVRYRERLDGTLIVAGSNLSPEERQEAFDALVERLGQYYRERVGAGQVERALRQALAEAVSGKDV